MKQHNELKLAALIKEGFKQVNLIQSLLESVNVRIKEQQKAA